MRKLAIVFFFWCSVVAQDKIKREIDDQAPITLRPVSKKELVGGNTFKYTGYDERDKTVNWDNGQSQLIFMTSKTKWVLKEKGVGLAAGKDNDDCPRLRSKNQLYAVATDCRGNPVKKPPITLKPIGKLHLMGGNTFSYSGVAKNGAEIYHNKAKSALLFYPKFKKWAMQEKGVGTATGSAGESCPIFKKNGKVYAYSPKCIKTRKRPSKAPAKSKASKKKPSSKKISKKSKKPKPEKKTNSKTKSKKPAKKAPAKKTSSRSTKDSIVLTPVGKDFVGGNTFKLSAKKNGVRKYSNGKSNLYFNEKNILWTLTEKGAGNAIGKKRSTCPMLTKKKKMYAFDTSCVPWSSEMKTKDWWNKRQGLTKAPKKNKKPVTKKSKKKSPSKKLKKKKTVAKKLKKKKTVAKKLKKKKSVSKKLKKKKTSKKAKKKSKASFISLKPIGKKPIVGGNKFKSAGFRKDGSKKYSNGKSELIFYPKDKKWALKEKGLGWAVGKEGKLCPSLSKKGKLYATSIKCVPKKKKTKKQTKKPSKKGVKKSKKSKSKKSPKKASKKSPKKTKKQTKKKKTSKKKSTKSSSKKSKKSKSSKKTVITLKPVGKKSIVGGNKFKSAGVRKDGTKKYTNGKSELLFKPKDKKWALKEKGLGWAVGKKGKLCPTLTKKGKLYATSTKCLPKKKKPSSKKDLKKSKKPKSKKQKKKKKAASKNKSKKLSKKSKKTKSSKKKKTGKKKSAPNVTKIVKLKPIPKYKINGGNTFRFQKVRKDGILKYSNGKSKLILGPRERKWALKDQKGWAVGKEGDECPVLTRKGKPVAKLACKKVSDKVLKPAKGIQIKGGNRFKYVKTWRNGVNEFRNPKGARLTYEGKKQVWLLKDPVLGYANGGVNEMICPAFKKKGKIIAEFNDCNNPKIKSKKKSKKPRKAKKSSKKKSSVTPRSVTLKPAGKSAIKGGNTFKFAKSRKDGVLSYSNGKSQLLFYPKNKKWALKEKGSGWAVGKKGDLCPKLSRKGKLYATSKQCLTSPSKKKAKKSKKNKKLTKKSKKNKKQTKKSSFGRTISLKTVGKKSIVGGNKFRAAGTRKDGAKKYRNKKSTLLFNPKNKKWALKEKGRGWAVGKPGALCPVLTKKGKPYAFSTSCKTSKASSKKGKRRSDKISYNAFKKFLQDLQNQNRNDSALLSRVSKLAKKNKAIFK